MATETSVNARFRTCIGGDAGDTPASDELSINGSEETRTRAGLSKHRSDCLRRRFSSTTTIRRQSDTFRTPSPNQASAVGSTEAHSWHQPTLADRADDALARSSA